MLETSPSVTRPVDEIATSVPMRSAMKAGRVNATSQVSVAFSSVNSRYARAGARATRSSRENAVEGFTRFGTAHVNTGAVRLSRRASPRNEKPAALQPASRSFFSLDRQVQAIPRGSYG